jgi:hypothetical protein
VAPHSVKHVSQARTLWEEGREPGYQVVALGLAVALSVTVLDLARADRVTGLFDVVFVLVCVALALLVRPEDFFTVGVLPPLIMAAVFLLVAVAKPAAIADPGDGLVQAVVSGLSTHAIALGIGYGLCLACLAVRRRFD